MQRLKGKGGERIMILMDVRLMAGDWLRKFREKYHDNWIVLKKLIL